MANICLYGSASDKVDNLYKEAVFDFGKKNALLGNTVVYGGGSCGLMGAVARGADSVGGNIIGVVPRFISQFEEVNLIGDTHFVETMAERKNIMEELSDAFIIAPGGIGTMDEFFQILTLDYLERYNKPIIIMNINGFYDNLSRFLEVMVNQNFLTPMIMKYVLVANSVDEAIEMISELK